MSATPLILGGTTEASDLARAMSARGISAVFSYAGRVDAPRAQPLPTRSGGFGGVQGLTRYLRDHGITHVIDATHPFAAQMSRNAVAACAATGIPLVALTRPAWQPVSGDLWQPVANMDAAVRALSGPSRRVFLALGRLHLDAFADQPQHQYLLRLVDHPDALTLPNSEVVVSRGPFTTASDTELMQRHGTEIVVCKNSGGSGAVAKLSAARHLGLPVIMIERPAMPAGRQELSGTAQVLDWLDHTGTDLGV